MTYFRATDPFPLESAEHTKLHEFYTRLSAGRLATTKCAGCGRTAWPPRGFCPECTSDEFEWIDLPTEGTIHGFTVQETGLPAGFDAPRVFAIVTVAAHRIFTNIPAGRRAHYLQPKVGHYGVFNGSRFRAEIAPRIADFIASFGAQPSVKGTRRRTGKNGNGAHRS